MDRRDVLPLANPYHDIDLAQFNTRPSPSSFWIFRMSRTNRHRHYHRHRYHHYGHHQQQQQQQQQLWMTKRNELVATAHLKKRKDQRDTGHTDAKGPKQDVPRKGKIRSGIKEEARKMDCILLRKLEEADFKSLFLRDDQCARVPHPRERGRGRGGGEKDRETWNFSSFSKQRQKRGGIDNVV